ncbi:MAG: hypothetical protein CMP59_08315 [Flavobacteriales bacterium]|nr:hypothetical protein [Flavobacteriales bacterium]|tara:strand:- start:142 stop:576 length:435 start_codon:yes stop_codon:yes gene_type:complete
MKKHIFSAFAVVVLFQLVSSCTHEPVEGPNRGGLRTTLDPSCDPGIAYFKEETEPLIQANCAVTGCHGNGSSSRGVKLDSYQDIISTAGINLNNPESSNLYQVLIDENESNRMPPAPRAAFTQDQINEVLLWIEQGAQNNECQE